MLNLTNISTAVCRRFASSSTFGGSYDVVIVGGGMVGNAMAASIGANSKLDSCRVLLLDAGKQKSLGAPSAIYSNRVSAVNPTSVNLFKQLGIWDRLEQYRIKKVSKLQVLDSCSQSTIEFEQPRSEQEVAFIIENNAITSALYDRILECPNLDVKTEVTVDSCVHAHLEGWKRNLDQLGDRCRWSAELRARSHARWLLAVELRAEGHCRHAEDPRG
ncbi:hypothetical protein L596_028013 [Steinernema carpocapsae]|uniref:FAD dependent oxidoreductase domain-containing protein n=1 Tax=Steinernema carpocapsae TaxID=34508 RepID=A0A4U5LX77_STECR|nr:hypothetical protein L596_028013 [Steinernema carpocapsae]